MKTVSFSVCCVSSLGTTFPSCSSPNLWKTHLPLVSSIHSWGTSAPLWEKGEEWRRGDWIQGSSVISWVVPQHSLYLSLFLPLSPSILCLENFQKKYLHRDSPTTPCLRVSTAMVKHHDNPTRGENDLFRLICPQKIRAETWGRDRNVTEEGLLLTCSPCFVQWLSSVIQDYLIRDGTTHQSTI